MATGGGDPLASLAVPLSLASPAAAGIGANQLSPIFPVPPAAGSFPAAKRKAAPGRDAGGGRKARKTEFLAPTHDAPAAPPGEAFAAAFLREYLQRGAVPGSQVQRLASNSRKWGLAHELPAGWYLIDDHPKPMGGDTLAHFDTAPAVACGWKVTGPQMKVFNPAVPVQIRYGNPKQGCGAEYSAMRAAVYTWCTAQPDGALTEGDVKLIHVYIGRASRNRAVPRRHVGRRTAPSGGRAQAVTLKDAVTQTPGNEPKLSANDVYAEIITQLRARSMHDAAAVAESVVLSQTARAAPKPPSPCSLPPEVCCARENASATAAGPKPKAAAVEAKAVPAKGAAAKASHGHKAKENIPLPENRAALIAVVQAEYVRLYHCQPPDNFDKGTVDEGSPIAYLLKKLVMRSHRTAVRMATLVLAYEKLHKETREITEASHNMAAKVLQNLALGLGDESSDDSDGEAVEEDEEVAGLRAAAAAAAPKKKKKGLEPELPTTCPSIPGGNLLKQELEVAYDVSRAEEPPAGHDAVVGAAPPEPCAANLTDMEDFGASVPALPAASTCLAALSTIQSERGQVCNDSDCYQAWVRSGVVCPTKRLPEVLAGNPSRPGSPRPPGPTRYEIERREWCAATPPATHGPVGTPDPVLTKRPAVPTARRSYRRQAISTREPASARHTSTMPRPRSRHATVRTALASESACARACRGG